MDTTAAASLILACVGAALGVDVTGPSTQQSPYMVASDPASGVVFYSIASNGNGVSAPNEAYPLLGGAPNASYRLVGTPDGLGAIRTAQDVADGTFTLLCNHELGQSSGVVRAHGSRGGFVSAWKIRTDPGQPDHLRVVGGRDLVTQAKLWRAGAYQTFNPASPMPFYDANTGVLAAAPNAGRDGLGRHCSGDTAAPGAYRFGTLGTDARIHLNGEETGRNGRALAWVASGDEAGTVYELPTFGDYSMENNVASPYPQAKTAVVGFDDATPGNVYVYVGTKSDAGTVIERAGLTNGALYYMSVPGVSVISGQASESPEYALGNATDGFAASKPFTLHAVANPPTLTGATLQSLDTATPRQMNWLRPEDGAWDPRDRNRVCFATTDTFSIASGTPRNGRSRLWAMDFTDVTRPELGGTVSMLVDGGDIAGSLAGGLVSATGATEIKMMDNIAVDRYGHVLIQEDAGNNARLGRLWLYDVAADRVTEIGISNAARFTVGGAAFLTQDEETSGILDAYDIIGPGWFLLDMQCHYGISGELVEGGQLMAVYVPQSVPACRADFDGSLAGGPGDPEVGDIFAFLSAWFAGAPLADYDANGSVEVADIFAFLSAWFAGC